MVHDVLKPSDLLHDELAQRRQSGFNVDQIAKESRDVDPLDHAKLLGLLDGLTQAERVADWPYEEPEGREAILATLPTSDPMGVPPSSVLEDKINGAWLGRVAGCNLGKPVENGDHWTAEHLRDYLVRAAAYPLRDYIPVLDPMPAGFEMRENWRETTLGRVNGSARDDDIDYPILGLHLLEQHGAALQPSHVAEAWLLLLPFLQVFTAERAVYRNLVHGLALPEVTVFRNPYREWIGAQIRGDVFGWTCPGDPRAAAMIAFQDASLSHVANGVYGEMWAAALVSCAFAAGSAREAVEVSLAHVPPRSRLHEAIADVLGQHASGSTWESALERIQASYGHYSWVHTINNAALVVAGLLWGEGDYAATVGLTVQGGWDTDSNGATAGSVAGVLLGAKALPKHLIEPLHDRTRSALFGFDNSRISDLAQRTLRLATEGLH